MVRVICIRKMGIFTCCLSLSAHQWVRRLLPQSSKTAFKEQFHHNVRSAMGTTSVTTKLKDCIQGTVPPQYSLSNGYDVCYHKAQRLHSGTVPPQYSLSNGYDVCYHEAQRLHSGNSSTTIFAQQWVRRLLPQSSKTAFRNSSTTIFAQQWVRRLLPRSSKTAFKEQFHHNVRFYSVRRVSLQVKANGVDFHCEQFGYGDHTVLLLPGAIGGSMTDFNCQLEKMNPEKFTIFGFDPRGYGRSIPPERDWPINFRHRDAEDAVAVMNTLGQKKFSVLGWSDGGITGLLLASQYPELVQKLVVWGTNAYITDKDMKMYQAVEDIDQWSARMKEPFIQVYGEKYFRVQWSNWVKAYSRYYTHNKGDICKAELKKITCPTFIIHGMKDPMVVAEHPVYLNKHIQNSRLHNMPEGKHNIHLRYADEFNKMVEDFLLE
ncbi:valacyclovir hydrolase-like isoform X3 [Haliotis rubra]|uniref:valacyclovir hydrolase-like isoform X3 n=1 Tax=Haliotis rubra TaxID=36100 RepID=UPI001EE6327B|nr:valacyclovir hydrolase-like isoform X3 [Haliotis rubra]